MLAHNPSPYYTSVGTCTLTPPLEDDAEADGLSLILYGAHTHTIQ